MVSAFSCNLCIALFSLSSPDSRGFIGALLRLRRSSDTGISSVMKHLMIDRVTVPRNMVYTKVLT